MKRGPVLSWKGHVGQDVVLALVHEIRQFRPSRPELASDAAPGFSSGIAVGLVEGLADRRCEATEGAGGRKREVEEDAVLFEGNSLENIDAYSVLPDTNYPIYEVKKSEYFGWIDNSNLMGLLVEEKNDEEAENSHGFCIKVDFLFDF